MIAELLAVNVLHRLRAAQGILRMADKHGPERLDLACARAVEVGDATYRTVKEILAARTESPAPAEPVGTDTPALLHGPVGIVAASEMAS